MLSPTPKGTYRSPGDDTVRDAFDDAYAWTTGLRGRGMWHLGRGEVLTRRRSSRFYIGGDLGGAVACARQASATSSTRRAQLLRTRTDAGTVDQPMPQVESCSRPVPSFWPEAKVRPGTTSAPVKIRVDGPVRKSVPNYSSVSSSLAPNFTPDVPRFHVPANK